MTKPQKELLPTKRGNRIGDDLPHSTEIQSEGRFCSNLLHNLLTELKQTEIARREEVARLQFKGRLGDGD